MRILYITTVGLTLGHFRAFIRSLLDEGHTVDLATNETELKAPECYREWGCKVYPLSTSRSPLSRGNLTAIKEIRQLVEENKYDIVHCHSPLAAMCTRFACRNLRKKGVKVCYTAHGFHFFKGAPLKNWLFYYPVERFCARYTDVLITINHEDYNLAKKKMRAKKVVYVPGVGIDLNKFGTPHVGKTAKRQELGVPENATLLLSVGELNKGKNHETVVRAIAGTENYYYMIAGEGDTRTLLQNTAVELGLDGRVLLLGYRDDINELCEAADIYVMPSFREGLPVSVMEAMASGLPCAVSTVRGNLELIDEHGGEFFSPGSVEECRRAILAITEDKAKTYGEYNRKKVEQFSIETINRKTKDVLFN